VQSDEFFMRRALELAAIAESKNEVPVGALVVSGSGEIIGEGFNCPISSGDPTAHAEIVALRLAAKKIDNYRLIDCTLYVTLEPCTMCCGALIHSRIKRVVYGAKEPKAGAVHSHLQLLDLGHTNHNVDVLPGICENECAHMLSAFFKRRREEKRTQK
jgi:tRNA(adenine34) deaminase